MILKKCILKCNDCYKKNVKMSGSPKGIVVHSTGVNNFFLKRYVQPLPTDKDYNVIIADIGKNQNANDWNRPGVKKCVHAFIGLNTKGQIETYQTLPYDICCWGCGSGSKGSYNNNPQPYLQFEICETDLTDKDYFDQAFKEAAEFCAYLADLYGIPVKKIVSHAEAHKEGYASNHGDPDHWLKVHNTNMKWFRAQVESILNKNKVKYTVQVGSFSKKENADLMLKKLKEAGFTGYIKKEGE